MSIVFSFETITNKSLVCPSRQKKATESECGLYGENIYNVDI